VKIQIIEKLRANCFWSMR